MGVFKTMKCCNQMWFELWHFIFVSFGKTFCSTLWYFGMDPRDIMVHMFIYNHLKESQVLSQNQAKLCFLTKPIYVWIWKAQLDHPS